MKAAGVAVAGLSLAMGCVFVLSFREPPRKKVRPEWEPRAGVDDSAPTPSRRVPIGGTAADTYAGTPKQPAARGVDPMWAQKNRAAIQALEKGELTKAVAGFEECVTAVPNEKVFRSNLAEALARLGGEEWDRGGVPGQASGIARMARAAELAPERDDIQKRLEQMRALAQSEAGNWTESSGHFDLSYDGARDDLSFRTTEIFDALEGAYLDFTEHFGLDPVASGRGRIRVVLYKREGFLGATGIGHWAGGLYDGSIRVPLEDLGKERRQLERVLRHELVHAFVHEAGGRDVPGWLNEGMAQRFESEDPATVGRSLDAARKTLGAAPLLSLETLSGSLGAVGDDAAIGRAYAQSLLFIDFLAREHGERVPFAMVAGCKTDGLAAEFERRTGLSLTTAVDDFATARR